MRAVPTVMDLIYQPTIIQMLNIIRKKCNLRANYVKEKIWMDCEKGGLRSKYNELWIKLDKQISKSMQHLKGRQKAKRDS